MTERLYTLSEMAERWNVTKQYVNKLKNEDVNFPKPTLEKGRLKLFTEAQVRVYEATKNFEKPHTNRKERIKREAEE